MLTVDLPRIIVGTDAFVPYLPPLPKPVTEGLPHIVRTLEACYTAGFRAMDFSPHEDLMRAVRIVREKYGHSVTLLGNLSWECGVKLNGAELQGMRNSVLATIYQRWPSLAVRLDASPMDETRRRWWRADADSRALDEAEILSIQVDEEFFRNRVMTMAEVADALLLGADYADWLVLLGRTDVLLRMFEIASAVKPVFSISHFTETTLMTLDQLPVQGHFLPYGKHTAFFAHETVKECAAQCDHRIAGTFGLLRDRRAVECAEMLIRFNLEAFPGSSVILGVSEPWQAWDLIRAANEALRTCT